MERLGKFVGKYAAGYAWLYDACVVESIAVYLPLNEAENASVEFAIAKIQAAFYTWPGCGDMFRQDLAPYIFLLLYRDAIISCVQREQAYLKLSIICQR